jgi:hypothetical protein
LTKARIWLGALSGLALVVMVAFTLPVGRPISDDYCGYATMADMNFFEFGLETYQTWMANFVGYGTYGALMQATFNWPIPAMYVPYFALGVLSVLALAFALSLALAVNASARSWVLVGVLAAMIYLGIFVTYPTGDISVLSVLVNVASYGVFHLWAPVLGLALMIGACTNWQKSLSWVSYSLLAVASVLVGLLGVIESLIYVLAVGVLGLVLLIRSRSSGIKSWLRTKSSALVFGVFIAGVFWLASPGVWARRESVDTNQRSTFDGFFWYSVSFVQDSIARALGNASLILVLLLASVAGLFFISTTQQVKRAALAGVVTVAALPFVALGVAAGEYLGYPAWYHELILNVVAVTAFVFLGVALGGVVAEKGLNPSRWAMVGLVGVYAFLLGVGVAAYLSRVEYLQDRADRWDAGYFTTIVHPTDGTLILPDGDSGIEWVAQCAKTFADLRGLEFKNY